MLLFAFAGVLAAATPSPPTPTPSPTAEPLSVSVRIANNDDVPVRIHAASLSNSRNFRYAQCVSFRNLSTKVATDVDLSFVVTNRRGETEAEFSRLDKGTFTPPISIDDHCWYGALWPARVVRRMTSEVVRVTRVAFADGSSWQPRGRFMRAYSNSGQPLAQPVAAGAASAGLPPARSTSPLAGESGYGAIFYEPGTFASGSAIDRPTAAMARDDARSACNQQTNGRNDCKLAIEFSGSRCGAIGVLSGDLEYGVGDNERDARAMVAGKIPGARIITADCNAAR
jgi:hypothetical protein